MAANCTQRHMIVNAVCLTCLVEQFTDGFDRGLTWPDQWESDGIPGGPYINGCPVWEKDPKRVREAAQSAAENRAWRDGWEKGHNLKKERGISNATI